ncbi:MAG: hypothetical protein ACRBCS_07280 [Cellvibrionaceae bacterium]
MSTLRLKHFLTYCTTKWTAITFIGFASLCSYTHAQTSSIPRSENGKPSFQGNWTNASITRLTKSNAYSGLIIPDSDINSLTESHPQVVRQKTDDHLDKESELLDGTDLSRGRGYNAFWIDPGKEYGLVNGTRRSRWITEPKSGDIPYHRNNSPQNIARGLSNNKILQANRSAAEGPEARSLGERCLISFGGSGGPPMLNTLYNNTYQFVQTDDYLMILVEMVHDVRIIPIVDEQTIEKSSAKNNKSIPRWLGNSIGWWENDALVVETTNWTPQQLHSRPIYLSKNAIVTERFKRISSEQIFYQFTINDPNYYEKTWSGEMSFNTSKGAVFEYACHEGNIGMEGILSGARVSEQNPK